MVVSPDRHFMPGLGPPMEVMVVVKNTLWRDDGVGGMTVAQERLVVDSAVKESHWEKPLMGTQRSWVGGSIR